MALAATSISDARADEPAAPEVNAISPDHGPREGGNTVVITGANFNGVTAVHFGYHEAESFTVVSDSEITAVAPPSFGSGEGGSVLYIDVFGPGGESGEWNPAAKYGYTPVIDEIDPGSGPAAGGTAVTLFGYGLEETTAVDFGLIPAQSFTINPDGSVTAISPTVSGGPIVPITATTPEGTTESFARPGSEMMPSNFFTYGPTVTSVTPREGPKTGGTRISIRGTGFKTSVFFCLCGPFVNSVTLDMNSLDCGLPFGAASPACSPIQFKVESNTEIVATTPPGSGTVNVGVSTWGGPSPVNPLAQFTYVPSISPEPIAEVDLEFIQFLNCAPSGPRLQQQGVARVCSSRGETLEVGSVAGSTTARLQRGRVLYAKGSAVEHRGRLRLQLKPLRSIKPGHYVLTLARPGIQPRRERIVIR
jgi:hypothetical protein